MTIHVLVEGPSEEAFLERWAKRLLTTPFRIHPHQGKGQLPKGASKRPDPRRRGLLDQLPAKLRAFAASMDPQSDGVLVLIDADDDDQAELVRDIETTIEASKIEHTRVTLAVEETEAFYLGDLAALKRAFPEADMDEARAYQADFICNTWERFGQIIGDGGGNKVSWAEAMGDQVTTDPKKTRSPSFRNLIDALKKLEEPRRSATKARRYRHAPKPRTQGGKR